MNSVLILKTGALGDVLRTTALLPGLARAVEGLDVTWVTAPAAAPLVERHRLVNRVVTCDPQDPGSIAAAEHQLPGRTWDWLLSLDDEVPLCELASRLSSRRLSGAYMDESGQRTYTGDVEPWFGMGLLSRAGKEVADRRKIDNRRTHPEIFAAMLGIEQGKPELPLPAEAVAGANEFAGHEGLFAETLVVGLNTGAGGRWTSKGLPVERVVAFAAALSTSLARPVTYLVLGGPPERERNDAILAGIAGLGQGARAVDAGTDNTIPNFAARLGLCDLLVTSDSLALHVAVALDVPTVAFFAPTSAAEIELYGLGEKVASQSDDYCSYRKDADNSTITAERLVAAATRTLELGTDRRRLITRPART